MTTLQKVSMVEGKALTEEIFALSLITQKIFGDNDFQSPLA